MCPSRSLWLTLTSIFVGTLMVLGGSLVAEDHFLCANDDSEASPILRAGDRIAWVGGTFVERMQSEGVVEAEIQCRRPDWKLSVRNLGWSGDDCYGYARKRFESPESGFKRLLRDVETADPTVVIVAYGFSAASNGVAGTKRFEPGLRRLIGELRSPSRRIVLMTPFAMSGYRIEGYKDSMKQCRDVVTKLGKELELPVLSIDWEPTPQELTTDRMIPNRVGYKTFAKVVADQLVGTTSVSSANEEVRQLVVAKNEWFFHRYRPQNETYLFLFRKHEQGNNAAEIPEFDPLIEQADRKIWAAAVQGSNAAAGDTASGERVR